MDDEILASVVTHSEITIKWDVLIQKILNKMTKTYFITTIDGRVLKYKLKLPELNFKVRSLDALKIGSSIVSGAKI